MSIWKEALRKSCKRKWRTCASMSDAESEDRASTVDDGGAFEEDADVDDGGAFEENADVDDGGADADLCDSM